MLLEVRNDIVILNKGIDVQHSKLLLSPSELLIQMGSESWPSSEKHQRQHRELVNHDSEL